MSRRKGIIMSGQGINSEQGCGCGGSSRREFLAPRVFQKALRVPQEFWELLLRDQFHWKSARNLGDWKGWNCFRAGSRIARVQLV